MKKAKAKAATNKSLLTLLIVAGVATLVVSYSYFNTQPKNMQPQKIGINEVVPSTADFASLKLVPAGATGAFASPFKLNLMDPTLVSVVIDGGANLLTGATVELDYDPTKLEILNFDAASTDAAIKANAVKYNFKQGAFFPVAIKPVTIDKVAKKIIFTYGIAAGDIDKASTAGGPKSGSGVLATFYVKSLVPGTTNLNFGANLAAKATTTANNTTNLSQIIAKGYTTNMLTSATPLLFTTDPKATADFTDVGDSVLEVDPVTGAIIKNDQVNEADYNFFLGAFGKTDATSLKADIAIPKNNKVDILDYAEFIRQWGL